MRSYQILIIIGSLLVIYEPAIQKQAIGYSLGVQLSSSGPSSVILLVIILDLVFSCLLSEQDFQ
jgi:hypothetical protein